MNGSDGPVVSTTAASRPAARAGAAGARTGAGPALVPRQLPAAPPLFVGREAELSALDSLLDTDGAGTVVISAIGGTAGVGKTALALQWAHRAADRFPDGQLFINLRGFDPSAPAVPPAEALGWLLGSLGVTAENVPESPDARAARLRSLMAGRRLLLVLDNARDAAQVRPLLPGSPGCVVLVTSRTQLAGLSVAQGARLLDLDVLAEDEALAMLAGRLGKPRIAAEPDTARELTRLCARLPLALAIVAARAATSPGLPLAALAAELRDAGDRLDALDAGDDPAASVRAIFSCSVRQLSPAAARMFRLLGLHPGPDIGVPAAASLAGLPADQARPVLTDLTRAHLLAEYVPGRYCFHDLLRAYAADQARAVLDNPERLAATGRMLDYYVQASHEAAVLMNPLTEPLTAPVPAPGVIAEQFQGADQALAWFEAEQQNVRAGVSLAAGTGLDDRAWRLARSVAPFLDSKGQVEERSGSLATGLAAAERLGDLAAQAMLRRMLAASSARRGDYDQASAELAPCLDLYRRLGDPLGEARVHQTFSYVASLCGHPADAVPYTEQALRLYQDIARSGGEDKVVSNIVWALNTLAWDLAELGDDLERALDFADQALSLQRERDLPIKGQVWDTRGFVLHKLGRYDEAASCYHSALRVLRQEGAESYEADCLTRLGDARDAAGQPGEAADAWRQALQILDRLHHPTAGEVRARLAGLSAGG